MTPSAADAYAYCERLAREHYENFPVASRLLPRRMRPHIAAVYAFARLADDMADEGNRPPADRLRDLDDWGARLHAAARGEPVDCEVHGRVFLALQESMRVCRLPEALFADLLSAFRQDVTTNRYETWHDVLDYCRRSANPVGRLVLRVAGIDDATRDAASDAVCTALQLTNFWQDFQIDWDRGRLYLPRDVWSAAGAREEDLTGRRLTPAWSGALAEAAQRTRVLFAQGRPICDLVRGRLRWELRGTWLGGMRVLEKLEESGFDPFASRPALAAGDGPLLLWRALSWDV